MLNVRMLNAEFRRSDRRSARIIHFQHSALCIQHSKTCPNFLKSKRCAAGFCRSSGDGSPPPVGCPVKRRPIAVEPAAATFRRRTVGRKITAVDRFGKRVVIRVEGGESIMLEPRMTGLVLLADPPTTEHLRFRIEFDDGRVLYYWDRRGLGSVRLYSDAELAARYDDGTLRSRRAGDLRSTIFALGLAKSRRAIKVALLDQRAVAGIGNLYASEMLFAARIDPRRRCTALRVDDWRRLHDAMRAILLDGREVRRLDPRRRHVPQRAE